MEDSNKETKNCCCKNANGHENDNNCQHNHNHCSHNHDNCEHEHNHCRHNHDNCNHDHDNCGQGHCHCHKGETHNQKDQQLKSKYDQAFDLYNLHLHDEIEQNEVKTLLNNHLNENKTNDVLRYLFGRIEITSLKVTDSEDSILRMVENINTFCNDNPAFPHPAGVCVYPRFIEIASQSLEVEGMEISTVCGGFPSAQTFPEIKTIETALALKDGATEIDTVMPVGYFLVGDYDTVYNELDEIRLACGQESKMKVILETGALQSAVNIKKAAIISMYSGADFIKTSTGKIEPGATPMAAYTMCKAIKEYYELTGRHIGIKVAGGIRTADDAVAYYTIVKEILGQEWLENDLFRIGASSLANNILSTIKGESVKLI